MFDLLVIGAGINGAGIARDAAGRGLRVALVEQGDIGGATSGASTKLIHGGLRYLEQYEFALVRKALAEREVLLGIAPHIAWPLAFILPHAPDLRPRWLIRAGLFLYDNLARRNEVPGSASVDLATDPAGAALGTGWAHGFRYWDGWVDDARLVVLNVRDAVARGAKLWLRTGVRAARRTAEGWEAELATGETITARAIVNAAGPWAGEVAASVLGLPDAPHLRLVQGAHLVTRRVNRTADAFMLQGEDRRIVFVIPYEERFSLMGTTERAVERPGDAACTPEEEAYLLAAANRYLARPLTPADIAHRYAGVRPLVEEAGVSARETTRDWRILAHEGTAAITIIGGKLTTYRLLAEDVLARLAPESRAWTATAPLPGGDVPRREGEGAVPAFTRYAAALSESFPAVPPARVHALARRLGTEAEAVLANPGADLGGIFEAEVRFHADHEWAVSPEDILWRRTKLGLTLPPAAQARVAAFLGTPALA